MSPTSRSIVFSIFLAAPVICLNVVPLCWAGADPVKEFQDRLQSTPSFLRPLEPMNKPEPPTDKNDKVQVAEYKEKLKEYNEKLNKYNKEKKVYDNYLETWANYTRAKLHTVSLLARACRHDKLTAHPGIYANLRRILKKEIHDIVANSSDAGSRRAMAALIAEMANSKSPKNKLFARAELWPFLETLAGSKEHPEVRAAALKAIGQTLPISHDFATKNLYKGDINPAPAGKDNSTKFGVTLLPVLEAGLKSGDPSEVRLCAHALFNIMEQINTKGNPSGSSNKYVFLEFNDSLRVVPGILEVAQTGLSSNDSAVRLKSLKTIDQACSFAPSLSFSKAFPKIVESWKRMLDSNGSFRNALTSNDPEARILSLVILEKIAALYAARVGRPSPIPPPKLLTKVQPSTGNIAPRGNVRSIAFQDPAGGSAKELLSALQDSAKAAAGSLDHPNVRVRLTAIDFLEVMANFPQTPEVVNGLAARIYDRDLFVRWAAARALGEIGLARLRELKAPDSETLAILTRVVQGVASLTDPQKERDRDVRLYAAKSLFEIAIGAKSARPPSPTVVKIIMDNSARQLTACAMAPHFDPPIPAFVRHRPVVSADQGPRAAALIALSAVVGGNGSDPATARRIAPQISPALNSTKPLIRQVAAETLGSFGNAAKGAVPALNNLLSDPVPEVRRAAGEAILNIQRSARAKRMPGVGD